MYGRYRQSPALIVALYQGIFDMFGYLVISTLKVKYNQHCPSFKNNFETFDYKLLQFRINFLLTFQHQHNNIPVSHVLVQ